MLRGVHVAHGHVLGSRLMVLCADGKTVAVSGGQADPAIYAAFEPLKGMIFHPWQQADASALRASDAIKWHRQTAFAWFGNTAQYPPVFYLGDALAYWAGRAGGLHVNATLIAARLCNALIFTLLGALAVAQARRTRPLLLVVLMLPMSLALGASASQDALMIPACALVVARLDRLIARARGPGPTERVALAVCLAALGMARPPYALFCLLLLQADRGRAGIIAACGACAAILLWCALVAARVMTPIGEADPLAQWHFLLAHPGAIVPVLVNTVAQTGTYAREFIGRLAWMDTALPGPYLVLAAVVLLLCVAGSMAGQPSRPGLAALAIGFAVCAMAVLQYFDWTPAGQLYVAGIVGRYFIPLGFVAGLGLPGIGALARPFRVAAYGGVAGMAIVTPAVVVLHEAARFYTG